MKRAPELIVMLTQNDRTVANAPAVFAESRAAKARIWGFKEDGLPLPQMQALYEDMRQNGKQTALEVVCYTEQEGLNGARMAAQCRVDYLMGTLFSPKILALCHENGLKYLPFVGSIQGRPSVLSGSIDGMIAEAKACLAAGADGIDLLAYRYVGEVDLLIRRFLEEIDAPVCIAGSINSLERVQAVRQAGPWAFTIGSAFFEQRFGEGFARQIDQVVDAISG